MSDKLSTHERKIIDEALNGGVEVRRIPQGLTYFDPLNLPSWRDDTSGPRINGRKRKFEAAKERAPVGKW